MEHLSKTDIDQFFDGTMEPAAMLNADDHLQECRFCRDQMSNLSTGNEIIDPEFLRIAEAEHFHLAYTQLEEFVDERLDSVGQEIVRTHVEICEECQTRLSALKEMKGLIAADTGKHSLDDLGQQSLADRLKGLFAGAVAPKFAFATVSMLLLAAIGLFWTIRRDPPVDSTRLTPTNTTASPGQTDTEMAGDENATANLPTGPGADANQYPVANVNVSGSDQEIAADNLPREYRNEIRRALDTELLRVPNKIAGLRQKSGALMSGGSEAVPFALVAPVGKVLRSSEANFRWRPLEGAESYVVNIYSSDFQPVVMSKQIMGTSWRPDRPLPRGKILIWQVTAIKNGEEVKSPVRPAPDAKFMVLSAELERQIAQIERELKNKPLLLGIVYAESGLLDEAEREFQKELKQNPRSTKAGKFLRQVRDAKRAN